MTNQEINISIAERQGWTNRHKTRAGSIVGALNEVSHVPIPNYSGDLNVWVALERELAQADRKTYQCILVELCSCPYEAIHATARQRAEAYLKTVGGWEA